MKISIGCDHGGISLKAEIVPLLQELGHVVDDKGCFATESVDYPDFAKVVCAQVQKGECERGILICGTGVGMSMVANRFEGIRAALCNELFTARMSREHNDANVLCMGARVVGPGLALEIARAWVSTDFAGGRHQRRIDMF
ncbi:MAG: ribose 5-phosphate isomerase B [Desulfobulbaceae bacterium]|nr:ribose 5-phosphate isomerase B [Desulfobulbaceae bacterium]HIJ90487.1 ribose 5-phosphate isomerase B [Deltaproteobacteria bacterium]